MLLKLPEVVRYAWRRSFAKSSVICRGSWSGCGFSLYRTFQLVESCPQQICCPLKKAINFIDISSIRHSKLEWIPGSGLLTALNSTSHRLLMLPTTTCKLSRRERHVIISHVTRSHVTPTRDRGCGLTINRWLVFRSNSGYDPMEWCFLGGAVTC